MNFNLDRKFAWMIVAVATLSVVCASDDAVYATYPAIEGRGKTQALIKRGEYLTQAGDCIACHTKKNGKPFAGGDPIKTPFGDFYAPNITPSKQYGLGQWTKEDFIQALHEGKTPNGQHYFPVFPYPYYSKLSREDVLAIWTYLQAIPAVEEPSQSHSISFPFKYRTLQFFWKMLFFYPYQTPRLDHPNQSDEWNRGAYLVEALAHCSMCHTPVNFLGAPERELAYTGNQVESYYAPNITGTNLKKIGELKGENDDQLTERMLNVFLHDKTLLGSELAAPPMLEVNHESLRYLTDEDLRAIVVYMKSTKDRRSQQMGEQSDDHSKAQGIYNTYCSSCHNNGLNGSPKIGSDEWRVRLEQKGEQQLITNAIKGIRGENNQVMPAMGLCTSCSEEDIAITVRYILSRLGETEKIITIKRIEPISASDGKSLYESNGCASCHSNKQNSDTVPQLGDEAEWTERLLRGGGFPSLIENLKYGPNEPQRKVFYNEHHCALPNGGCTDCDDRDLIAMVKYIIEESISGEIDVENW